MLLDLQAQGMQPLALKNRPLPRRDCIKYREAFHRIARSRKFNEVGMLPIEMSEILAYLEIVKIEAPLQRETYMQMICALDDVFLEYVKNKQQSAKPQESSTK